MLVISRKANQTIEFPELGISVEVLKVKGNGVRLGVKASESVRILRGELVEVVSEFEDVAPSIPFAQSHKQLDCQLA